ncbi:hypothetical protein NPX13_g3757 [Xylaria arbuscula]|uniref:Uncharacterized protein n=1 Tax=Xylaria arbuscula TaxID=114810 RepID=A0A9W8NHA5_9PEZI|nr:hypothetical protein NPX13_g3757 [Xylaria arbuscula]
MDGRRLRTFFLRSTPEWDAVAKDGLIRKDWKYEFIRLSELTTHTIFIMPGIELDGPAVKGQLFDFISLIEPSLQEGVIRASTLGGTWCW